MVGNLIQRKTENTVVKKQKDKKINNGRHNNTQTNRQYNGQETKRQIENCRKHNIQKNKQHNCEKEKKDKQWWTRYYTE